MCLRRAPEKYIAGAALDRAGLDSVGSSTSHSATGLQGLLREQSRDSHLCRHFAELLTYYLLITSCGQNMKCIR
jgi:hypothetical protein